MAALQSVSPKMSLMGSLEVGVDPELAIWNQLETLLHTLSRRPTAWVFRMPVDPVKASAPDYYDIVKCATCSSSPRAQSFVPFVDVGITR